VGDSVLGMFCALYIFYATFLILKESISKILGEKPKQDLLKNSIAKLN